jgi:hypothetical protein
MTCTDMTHENGAASFFPPVPGFVKVILRNLVIPRKKNWWRFAPCDASGKPRALPFAK